MQGSEANCANPGPALIKPSTLVVIIAVCKFLDCCHSFFRSKRKEYEDYIKNNIERRNKNYIIITNHLINR